MKKIIFLLLISILSLNLFAHTKMYHVDLSANIISFDDEEHKEPTGNSDGKIIDDSLQCLIFLLVL